MSGRRAKSSQEPSNQFQRIYNGKNELWALRLENFQFIFNGRNTKCANEFLTGYRFSAVTNLPMLFILSGVSARTLEQNIAVTAFF